MDIVKAGAKHETPPYSYFFLAHAATWVAFVPLGYPILRDLPDSFIFTSLGTSCVQVQQRGTVKLRHLSIESHCRSSSLVWFTISLHLNQLRSSLVDYRFCCARWTPIERNFRVTTGKEVISLGSFGSGGFGGE